MKILILGASGFIGRNLYEFLAPFKQYELYCPSHTELDLLDEYSVHSYLNDLRPDVVIDSAVCRNPLFFASVSSKSELEQDLRMFYNLQKNDGLFGKMLYFGSGAEFDKTQDIVDVKEDEFNNSIPKNQYGLAKYIIGKSIEQSSSIYNFRVFGLFGKYENWRTTFISGACCKAIKKLPITIRQDTYFDYLDINDFCPAVKWFIDSKPKHHTYNVCSGRKVSLRSIAEKVRELSGNDVPIYVCQPGYAKEYTANNSRLKSEYTDFVARDLGKSISELMEYYRSIEQEIDLVSLLY